MSRKRYTKKESFTFSECETCGDEYGLWRWYNEKVECSSCATRSFIKYLSTIAIGIAVIVIIGIKLIC
jgi:hypothetical protein